MSSLGSFARKRQLQAGAEAQCAFHDVEALKCIIPLVALGHKEALDGC